MINHDPFIALLPLLLSSLLVILVMTLIAIRRCHATVSAVTVLGLAAALGSVPYAMTVGPQAVSALFIVDGMSLFYSGLILAAALAVTLLLRNWLAGFGGNREEMYLLLALSVNGALVLVSARNLASFFIGLELMSVPVYGMAGYLFMQRRSLESLTKYLVLSAAATAVMLFGMALLYAQGGELAFSGIAKRFATGHGLDTWLAQVAILLLFSGMAFKLSLAPFHQWTLDVYEGAPAPVGAYLATVGKVAVVAVLLRFLHEAGLYGMTPSALPMAPERFLGVLSVIAVASILVGNLLALRQANLKRLLAASSISHFGYLLVAVIAGGAFARETAGMYLTAYVATTLGAFGVISLLSKDAVRGAGADGGDGRDVDTIDALRGLGTRSPFLAVALTVMLLSLAGMPLTAGFLGKFYVITAGADAHLWGLLLVIVAGSAIGLSYYLRVVATLWRRDEAASGTVPEGMAARLAIAAAMAVVLLVGIWPQPLIDVLTTATLSTLP